MDWSQLAPSRRTAGSSVYIRVTADPSEYRGAGANPATFVPSYELNPLVQPLKKQWLGLVSFGTTLVTLRADLGVGNGLVVPLSVALPPTVVPLPGYAAASPPAASTTLTARAPDANALYARPRLPVALPGPATHSLYLKVAIGVDAAGVTSASFNDIAFTKMLASSGLVPDLFARTVFGGAGVATAGSAAVLNASAYSRRATPPAAAIAAAGPMPPVRGSGALRLQGGCQPTGGGLRQAAGSPLRPSHRGQS